LSTGCVSTEQVLYKGKPTEYWVKQLKDKDVDTRFAAVGALEAIAPENEEAVLELIEVLKNKDEEPYVYNKVIKALGKIGSYAVPMLVTSLKNHRKENEAEFRCSIVWALVEIGPEANTAIPTLTELLKDSNEEVRYSAVVAVGEIGPGARMVVPILKDLLKDPDEFVRNRAEDSLGKIRGEDPDSDPGHEKK